MSSTPSGLEPGRRRRRALPAAAGAVVLAAVAGAVLLLGGRDGATDAAAPPAGALRPGAAATAPGVSPSPRTAPPSTAAEAAPAAPLNVPPEGVRWQVFEGVALPYSDIAGPGVYDGPVLAGFEQSPTGALLAATHVATRYAITPGEGWREVVTRQAVDNAGRAAYLRLREEIPVTAAVPPGTYGQIAGFRFVTYSPDVAAIQLITRYSTGALQVATITVRWGDGDWKLELQPDGSASATQQTVSSLDRFVVWGGV